MDNNEELQRRIDRLEQEAGRYLQDMTKMRDGLERINESIQIFYTLTLDMATVAEKILDVYANSDEQGEEYVRIPTSLLRQLQRARDDWNRMSNQMGG